MDIWKDLSPSNKFAAFLVASFAGIIIWLQLYFWENDDEYGFGYLVPIFVVYVIYDRWPKIIELFTAGGEGEAASLIRKAASFVSFLGICFGLLFMLSGVIRRLSDGPTELGAVIATVGFIGFISSFLFILTDEDSAGKVRSMYQRLSIMMVFMFPILIWLVSVPLAKSMQKELALFLLSKVVLVVLFIFNVLGIPIEQTGNVLTFVNGDSVGVEDACSGIRSLTACIFAGSFLAATFLDTFTKKALYIALAIGFAFLTNISRSLFLTAWAYNYGSSSVDELVFTSLGGGISIHDIAGYSVMGLTITSLLCLLPLFLISAVPEGEE